MHRADGQPFLFAGLYEAWYPQPDQPQTTFTILTTDANDALASIHARMPVTVPQGHLERWLDPHSADLDALSPDPPPRARRRLCLPRRLPPRQLRPQR